MFEIREADISDLNKVAKIHKAAYSRDHFSALLPDSALVDYYKNFLSENSYICLVYATQPLEKGCAQRYSKLIGFVVFGVGIPEKISYFKRKNRKDILLTALKYPLLSLGKLFVRTAFTRKLKQSSKPSDFLLLSIAVSHSGIGAGRALLNTVTSFAKHQGFDVVGLYVGVKNVAAINAYSAAGYKIVFYDADQFYMEKLVESI